ncbi:MAG TPA: E3 ubiquitin ligase family protein [Chloroflexota bacterium]|nr:E3 ubiquitin ligase family protein [Chloroflexota bacterium]
MLIAGIALVAIGIVLLLVRRSHQSKLADIQGTEGSTAAGLMKAAAYVGERMGSSGSYGEMTQLSGAVKCDSPITAQLSQQPCVYYSMNVTREYEEEYWETNSQTKERERKTRHSSQTVSSNSDRVPFYLEDATGRILVDPAGGDIEAVQVVDRFENGEVDQNATVSFGSFTFSFSGLNLGGSGTRTIGYRYKESVLPLDRRLFVLGEANDRAGELRISKPKEGKRFIITVKSQEELVQSTISTVKWLLYGGVGLDLLGVILIIVGLVKK